MYHNFKVIYLWKSNCGILIFWIIYNREKEWKELKLATIEIIPYDQ